MIRTGILIEELDEKLLVCVRYGSSGVLLIVNTRALLFIPRRVFLLSLRNCVKPEEEAL